MNKLSLYFLLWLGVIASAMGAQIVPITTTPVVQRPLIVTTLIRGTLESPTVPLIAAETAGQITQIAADEGDSVKKGQLLVKLDSEIYQINLESAQADIPRLNALIANQQLTLKRYQSLVARQSSSQNELDKAKTDLEVLLAELAKTKVKMKEIQYRLDKTQIFSPIAGLVYQRLVSTGDYVQTGTPLFRLVATEQLHARLYVPETLVDRIQAGQAVQLETTVKEQKIDAKVTRLRPMLNPTNRALEILVWFDNLYHWKAGTSVIATLALETRPHALMIPERCIVSRPAGNVVYAVGKGVAKQRPIQTGQRDGEWMEITQGLAVGEKIALEGAVFLTDGATVKEQSNP